MNLMAIVWRHSAHCASRKPRSVRRQPQPLHPLGHRARTGRGRSGETRLVTLALVLPLALGLSATGAEFYVAPDGSDANPGTKRKPFATLEAARDAVRQLKQKSEAPKGVVNVWIRGGTYVRERSFELTAADSGAPGSPIMYRGYRDEAPRLLGGQVVRDFQSVRDAATLQRLPEAARAHVLVADLRAQGITNFGELRSRGFGRSLTPAHLELFFDGQPMTLARWPNEGEFEKIAGFPETSGQGDDHGGKIGALNAGFGYAGDHPRGWQASRDLWVHGYWAWDWANSYERVQSLDPDQHLIKTAPPHGLYGFRKGQRFYFLNVLEELDQPGEWFLDRQTGRLYFWPPHPIDKGEVLVSLLDQPLISLNDASHVTVRGLALEASRGHGISVQGGTSNQIVGCALRLLGNYGVQIEGGQGHRVAACDIENTGDGGVSISGGDRQTLTPGSHVVENCHFQKQGRWSKCYVPAVLVGGVGHRVAHNLIHDHPHCAILFSGNDHVIEFNEIHHVALETGDVGAIYTGRDYTYRGNVIRHNFIHDTGGVGMGSMGVYMDDCVSGTEISGNVFYRVQRAAFLGGGRDHQVVNNIFIDCTPAVSLDGRGLDKSPVWHNMVANYMNQRLADVPPALYRQRYPALTTLDQYYPSAEAGIPPEGNVIERNISVGGKWLEVYWHADAKLQAIRDNYVGADPGFVAPEKMDFRLKPDSPAWKIGFKPIPMDQIGLQQNAERRQLERFTRRAN